MSHKLKQINILLNKLFNCECMLTSSFIKLINSFTKSAKNSLAKL